MAVEADWERNLFHSDPTLLERSEDGDYERAAAALAMLSDPARLKLLHALSVGEDTAQSAAVWSAIPQTLAERELAAMARAGVVERHDGAGAPRYAPRDGHIVVEMHVALAHGREIPLERQPRMLARRRAPKLVGRAG